MEERFCSFAMLKRTNVCCFRFYSYFCGMMNRNGNRDVAKESKKLRLWRQLEKMGCVWSYTKGAQNIDDNILIEKALLYLEFEDLHKLKELYSMNQLRSVWRKRLVSQGDYYGIINWLLAAMFFGIKNPDKYLKRYGKPELEARA